MGEYFETNFPIHKVSAFREYIGHINFARLEEKIKAQRKKVDIYLDGLKNIPGVIIQGRYDLSCPYINAWTLHKAWPNAEFITTLAGHHGSDQGNLERIIEYTDKFLDLDY